LLTAFQHPHDGLFRHRFPVISVEKDGLIGDGKLREFGYFERKVTALRAPPSLQPKRGPSVANVDAGRPSAHRRTGPALPVRKFDTERNERSATEKGMITLGLVYTPIGVRG
jgi:hypothetical protein